MTHYSVYSGQHCPSSHDGGDQSRPGAGSCAGHSEGGACERQQLRGRQMRSKPELFAGHPKRLLSRCRVWMRPSCSCCSGLPGLQLQIQGVASVSMTNVRNARTLRRLRETRPWLVWKVGKLMAGSVPAFRNCSFFLVTLYGMRQDSLHSALERGHRRKLDLVKIRSFLVSEASMTKPELALSRRRPT